jgi:hypothetical protein
VSLFAVQIVSESYRPPICYHKYRFTNTYLLMTIVMVSNHIIILMIEHASMPRYKTSLNVIVPILLQKLHIYRFVIKVLINSQGGVFNRSLEILSA